MVKNKIGCVFYYSDKRYDKLASVAYSTFNNFHKDEVTSWLIGPEELKNYQIHKMSNIPAGIMKYSLAYEIFITKKLEKIIILGADTITCSRMDEFLDDNSVDILCTLDYPYQLITPFVVSPDSETHVNADVVCFNNPEALLSVIKASYKHNIYFEQGGLNEILYHSIHNYSYKIVDYPYRDSNVVYNARAKGNTIAQSGTKPWAKFTNRFHVQNGNLWTGLHENNLLKNKIIKVWHYCDGLGCVDEQKFEEIINWWINEGFNEDTKNFFSSISDEAKSFFSSKFVIE